METTIKTHTIINKPRRVVRNAFIITALLIAGAVIIGYSNLDGMNGGYALIVFLGLFAISSLITALMYIPRAREFNKLIHNLNPVVHWSYSQQEWDTFVKEDLKETMVMNKAKLRLIIIISAVVCILLVLIYQDVFFIWIIAALILLLSFVAFIAPFIRRGILRRGVHEAFIGENAVYVGGTFQTWNQFGMRLTDADINTDSAIPILNIMIEFPTRYGMDETSARVPVPTGKLEEAKKIVETLHKKIKE